MSINDTSNKKAQFLDEHVFFGLNDLNTGFDSPNIRYFSADDFRIVLLRVEKLGLGIYGIEPWRDGHLYDVVGYEEYSDSPVDPKWYNKGFEQFVSEEKDLQYSASYYVTEELLND